MTKKLTWMVMMTGLAMLASVMLADDNAFGVEWDAEAVKTMSRTERLAYQKEYKAALEAAALKAGLQPKAHQPSGRTAATQTLNPDTSITYHSGTLSPATTTSVSVGNRFDTALTVMGALGPVEMSGSITMVTADLAAASGNVFVSVYDQLSGTTANQVTSRSTPMVTGFNSITLPTALNYVGTSFLAGVWNFTGAGDTVNVATGTVGGQGFHGMSINDGNPGNGFNAFTMTNGAVGVGGNVATPVELMSFSID